MMTAPGGIDLNPAMTSMNIHKQGGGMVLPDLPDPENLDSDLFNLDGITPVILDITPAANLSEQFGSLNEPAVLVK